jgi:hypothetical protein
MHFICRSEIWDEKLLGSVHGFMGVMEVSLGGVHKADHEGKGHPTFGDIAKFDLRLHHIY